MTLVKIFSAILKMSLTASVVILVVCAARLAMKRAPKIYSYLLWALVLFRLLCPIALFTSVSVVPSEVSSGAAISDWEADYIEEVQVHYNGSAEYEAAVSAGRAPVSDVAVSDRSEAPSEGETVHYDGGTEQESAAGTEKPSDDRSYVITGKDGISEPKTVKNTVMPLLACVWIAGMLALLIPGMISYIRIKRKTQVVIPLRKNIYIGDDVESPFVMGIFRPVIYLPGTLDASEREYIIAHESHHIRRGDHIFKVLAFLALTLHWFNPLVWLAFALAVRDMEMSCDEAVIRKLGEDVRAEYSASLLKLATGHRLFAGSPLAFGENDPAGRVRNLSKWKKPAIWVIILCLVVCAVLAVVLLTNLDSKEPEQNETTPEQTTVLTEEISQPVMLDTTEAFSGDELFSMEDFSSLVVNQSTYEDLCNLMPESQQPEIVPYPDGSIGYCWYPTKGGAIRINFREDLTVRDIRFYPSEGSEFYPIKDSSVFSFIVPGETTLMEVMNTVPHPTYGVPATGGMLSWLTYEVVDGSEVRIFFDTTKERRGIVHSVEIVNNKDKQPVKSFPLIFAEIGDDKRVVTVFAYISDGKLKTMDQFSYSGKPLDAYLEEEEPANVTSLILSEGKEFAFMNKNWGCFRAACTGFYCEGEALSEAVQVYGELDRIPNETGYYLGVPTGVTIYPNSIARQVNGFSMHLNTDDRIDQVAWTFTESEEGENLFNFTVKVKVGDKEQVLIDEKEFPCGKDDLAIWPIDLEQDGIYELAVYDKAYFRFGQIRIYKLNGTTYELQFYYELDCLP